MNKDKYMQQFFSSDGYCEAHNSYKCSQCMSEVDRLRANANNNALTLVVSDSTTSNVEKASAHDNFKRQQKYIKKALKLSDRGLARKKLTEIPKLMKKAADEITIGGMSDLLEEEYIPSGVVRSITNAFIKIPRMFRRRR